MKIGMKCSVTNWLLGYGMIMIVNIIKQLDGTNDGDIQFQHKDLMQHHLLKFYGIDRQSYLYNQQGLYRTLILRNRRQDLEMMVILLDLRYHKDPQKQDMLGKQQWNWLEQQLKNYQYKLIVIGSSIQFLPDDRYFPESWYQQSKDRLKQLINKYDKYVLILSGDVHHGEILFDPLSCQNWGFPLYELTASGFTHLIFSYVKLGFWHFDLSFITQTMVSIFFPDTFSNVDDKLFDYNYGSIELLGNQDQFQLIIQIRNQHNRVIVEKQINQSYFDQYCNNYDYSSSNDLGNKYLRQIRHVVGAVGLLVLKVVSIWLFIGLVIKLIIRRL